MFLISNLAKMESWFFIVILIGIIIFSLGEISLGQRNPSRDNAWNEWKAKKGRNKYHTKEKDDFRYAFHFHTLCEKSRGHQK